MSVLELQGNRQEITILQTWERTHGKSLSSWLRKESKQTNGHQFLSDLREEPVQELRGGTELLEPPERVTQISGTLWGPLCLFIVPGRQVGMA